MAKIRGSHWQGPVLGDDRCAGGIWEDLPLTFVNGRIGPSFVDDFLESRSGAPGTHWTQTNIVAGTVSFLPGGGVQLSHNVIDQGPSVKVGGTVLTGIDLYQGGDPADNDHTNVAAIEARIRKFAGTSTGSDGYFGFGTNAAAHPLTTGGVPNTAGGVTDGAGWIWTASNIPVPALWDNSTVRTLTSVTTPALNTITTVPNGHIYGVRVDTTNALRDIVSWYVNGRVVLRASPGGAAPGQFGSVMTAYFGIVAEAGSAQTFQMHHFCFGSISFPADR